MKVVIVSATEFEVSEIKKSIKASYTSSEPSLSISFLTTGIGMLASCFTISKLLQEEKPKLVIQAGIAGAFNEKIALGDVKVVKSEFLGDTGVEENKELKDLFDLNFIDRNMQPFNDGQLKNPWLTKFNLLNTNEVDAITINEITTRKERISQIINKYNPSIESMEGAALHYCCLQTSTPFIQIRSVSNYVGERDKSKWRFKESFESLAVTLLNYIEELKGLHF